MPVRGESVLLGGLAQLPSFAEWKTAADAVLTVKGSYPTLATQGESNIYDISHETSHTKLRRAAREESKRRNDLQVNIADPAFKKLDVIAKLSALSVIGRFEPLADVRDGGNMYPASSRGRRSGVTSDSKSGAERLLSGNVAEVIGTGMQLDTALRDVDKVLSNGCSVEARTINRWSELYITPKGRSVNCTYDEKGEVFGRIENRITSFPLVHPDILSNGTIKHHVPTKLSEVYVERLLYVPPRGYTKKRPFPIINIYLDEQAGHMMDVPLPSVMAAQGESTTYYDQDFTDKTGRSVAIKIGSYILVGRSQLRPTS